MGRQKRIQPWELTAEQLERVRGLVEAGLNFQDAAMLVLMSDHIYARYG
jgi:hypothetical protein